MIGLLRRTLSNQLNNQTETEQRLREENRRLLESLKVEREVTNFDTADDLIDFLMGEHVTGSKEDKVFLKEVVERVVEVDSE